MDVDLELMDANYSLYGGIATGDRIRVVADHATYEGHFKTLFVNQHGGLGLMIAHTRIDGDGHTIECETGLQGAMIRRLERLDGPAGTADEDGSASTGETGR